MKMHAGTRAVMLLAIMVSGVYLGTFEAKAEAVSVHPGDANADWRIVLSEAIAYLAGWQGGSNPMAYAIRAAYLWQNGELYHYDAGENVPLCWALGSVEGEGEGEGEVFSLMLGLGAVNPEYIHGTMVPSPEPIEICPPLKANRGADCTLPGQRFTWCLCHTKVMNLTIGQKTWAAVTFPELWSWMQTSISTPSLL